MLFIVVVPPCQAPPPQYWLDPLAIMESGCHNVAICLFSACRTGVVGTTGASMCMTIGLIICASAVSTVVMAVGITVGVGGAIAMFECRESHGYGC